MKTLLTFVVLCGVTSCASLGGRGTALTRKIEQQNQIASQSINNALSAKDQIRNLIKENQNYDAKETKLINSLYIYPVLQYCNCTD